METDTLATVPGWIVSLSLSDLFPILTDALTVPDTSPVLFAPPVSEIVQASALRLPLAQALYALTLTHTIRDVNVKKTLNITNTFTFMVNSFSSVLVIVKNSCRVITGITVINKCYIGIHRHISTRHYFFLRKKISIFIE